MVTVDLYHGIFGWMARLKRFGFCFHTPRTTFLYGNCIERVIFLVTTLLLDFNH